MVPCGARLLLHYGIKQAPRAWNLEINNFLLTLGYTRLASDTCVYAKRSRTDRMMFVPLFVDDMFPACHKDDDVELDNPLAYRDRGGSYRFVEHIGAVGCGDHDHAGRLGKAIHLDQQLIQGLLALVVATTHAGAALATNGIDLVDEDDAR